MLNTKKLITKILDAITPSSKTKVTFTLNSKFTGLSGGVWKIGKLRLVNLSATVSGTFAANDYYTLSNDFPVPSLGTALTVTTPGNFGNKGAVAMLDTTGRIVIQSGANALTNLQVFVTGLYLGGNS